MSEHKPFERLLLTGAAGRLGQVLRPRLAALARTVRVTDIATCAPAGTNEEVVLCDLADGRAVDAMVTGCDAIVHFGGVSGEDSFQKILHSNIEGTFNVYEAARRHRVRRITFASSNHVVGFYQQDERIDAAAPLRPDTNYAVSKAFGENLARFYFDRYQMESVCLRIGSAFPEPRDRRMLTTWLSYDDLYELVCSALTAPRVGYTVVFGASNNRDSWWDNRLAQDLRWGPQDTSEPYRVLIETRQPLDPGAPSTLYQGGAFCAMGPFDETAS